MGLSPVCIKENKQVDDVVPKTIAGGTARYRPALKCKASQPEA